MGQTPSKHLGSFLNLGDVSFKSWEDGLRVLFNLSKKDKLVVVLDGFQYLAENNEEVLSILQTLLDEYEDLKMNWFQKAVSKKSSSIRFGLLLIGLRLSIRQ